MSGVYLTAMGSLSDGISINAVQPGENGWVYMAGMDRSGGDGLVVLGYRDGALVWKKKLTQDGFSGFDALTFKNGDVYVAGGIAKNFADITFANTTITKNIEKMALPENGAALIEKWGITPTFPIYAKIDGLTGTLEYVNVLPSPQLWGEDRFRSISVADDGSVYVAGSGWNPVSLTDYMAEGSTGAAYIRKFSSSGEEIWTREGDHVVWNPFDKTPYMNSGFNIIEKLNPENGLTTSSIVLQLPKTASGYDGCWVRNWIFDAPDALTGLSNIYVVAGFYDDHQEGVVQKYSSNGQLVWSRQFGINSDLCMPNSITFDRDGNLLIGGYVQGKLETGIENVFKTSSNNSSDGFLLKLDSITGDIITTDLIGGAQSEYISQVAFIGEDIFIGGSFDLTRYSLEGKSEKNLYLVSEKGFFLIGNAFENEIQGSNGNDTIDGGLGNDTLIGGGGTDTLVGGTGSDELYAGNGNDSVDAGIGNDLIVAGDGKGNDTYNGGDGSDTLKYTSATAAITVNLAAGSATSTAGNDASKIGADKFTSIENVIAGSYNDLLIGSDGSNRISGGAGADTIIGGKGIDRVIGDNGNDVFILAALTDFTPAETITGGEGVDELRVAATTNGTLVLSSNFSVEKIVIGTGTENTAVLTGTTALNVDASLIGGAVQVIGNNGTNAITGSAFDDTLDGRGGNDRLVGGLGNDTLVGGAGNDTLIGGSGIDTASYASANESLNVSLAVTSGQNVGSFGADTITGIENLITGSGNDTLTGNDIANVLNGAGGNDALFGRGGHDSLIGGIGNDTLFGGLGNDTLTGGTGADRFVFDSALSASTNRDTITDFVSGTDKIGLSKATFTALSNLSVGTNIKAGQFWSGAGVTAAHDTDDRIIYNTSTGALYYDADGTGAGAAIQIATLTNKAALNNADFLIL